MRMSGLKILIFSAAGLQIRLNEEIRLNEDWKSLYSAQPDCKSV